MSIVRAASDRAQTLWPGDGTLEGPRHRALRSAFVSGAEWARTVTGAQLEEIEETAARLVCAHDPRLTEGDAVDIVADVLRHALPALGMTIEAGETR